MMTRKQFVEQAVREHERRNSLPEGWWGSWRSIYGPNGQAVRFSGHAWIVRLRGVLVSRHDSRDWAIAKARKL